MKRKIEERKLTTPNKQSDTEKEYNDFIDINIHSKKINNNYTHTYTRTHTHAQILLSTNIGEVVLRK